VPAFNLSFFIIQLQLGLSDGVGHIVDFKHVTVSFMTVNGDLTDFLELEKLFFLNSLLDTGTSIGQKLFLHGENLELIPLAYGLFECQEV